MKKLQKDLSADPNTNYKILTRLLEIAKKCIFPKRLRNLTCVSTEKKFE